MVVAPPKFIAHKSVLRVISPKTVVEILDVVSDELLEEEVSELVELDVVSLLELLLVV